MWGKYTIMIKVNVNIIGGKTWFCDKNKFKGEETGWVTNVALQVSGQVMEIRYGDKNVSFVWNFIITYWNIALLSSLPISFCKKIFQAVIISFEPFVQ